MNVLLPSPGPQLIVTVCMSLVPGSLKVPFTVAVSFSLIELETRLRATISGSTLFTVTLVDPVPTPVSSSVTVTLIV